MDKIVPNKSVEKGGHIYCSLADEDLHLISMLQTTEKNIINLIHKLRLCGGFDEQICDRLMHEIDSYYRTFFTSDRAMPYRTDALLRLLETSLTHPVIYNINADAVNRLYSHYAIINVLTYLLFQLSDKTVNPDTVDNFINYMDNTGSKKLYVFYLYRLDPKRIKTIYPIDNYADLTAEELYYGITTGYFSYPGEVNDALYELRRRAADKTGPLSHDANHTLAKLEKNGYNTRCSSIVSSRPS